MSSFNAESDDEDASFEQLFKIEDDNNEKFYYVGYDIDISYESKSSVITFRYRHGKSTNITSLLVVPLIIDKNDMVVAKLLFNIGMCVMMWYWMGYACREIVLSSVLQVDTNDLIFWNHHINQIVSEFVFVHKLSYSVQILAEEFESPVPVLIEDLRSRSQDIDNRALLTRNHATKLQQVLLGVGGGKDSIVAWHLLRKQEYSPLLVYIADSPEDYSSNTHLHEVIRLMLGSGSPTIQNENVYVAVHDFHCEVFEKYSRSYYKPCGHPWAALVLFDTALIAHVTGVRQISFGFEKSANFGNGMSHNGIEVNHQYDKSWQFVSAMSDYLTSFELSLSIESTVGDMMELEIARIFCQEPSLRPFHRSFQSCNEITLYKLNSQHLKCSERDYIQRGWCCACEKCAFVYLLLSAWLPPAEVQDIFGGRNLFQHQYTFNVYQRKEIDMQEVYRSLLGLSQHGFKPFECIGTPEESAEALRLARAQYLTLGQEIPHMITELMTSMQHIANK